MLTEKIALANKVSSVSGLHLYSRAGVGTHLGMMISEGKANSIIIGITHSKSLPNGIETFDCEFSSLGELSNSNTTLQKKEESRAILTIVDNKTMQYKNQKILNNLKYKTGLTNKYEQEKLKEKIFLKQKITHLENVYNKKDTYILYQTKKKTELISIYNQKRFIELIGVEMYDKEIKPFINLSENFDERRLSIAETLNKKINKEGIEGVLSIMKKIGW